MDETGRMMVAWKSQRVNEGESNSPAVVSFITAAPGHGFGSRRTIETVGVQGAGRFVSSPGVRLAVTGRDQALLAWTGFDGTHFVARALPLLGRPPRGRQALSPAGTDAVLGDLAVANDGRALALWRSDVLGADPAPAPSHTCSATFRAAGAQGFGAPEAIGGTANEVLTPLDGRRRAGAGTADRAVHRLRDGDDAVAPARLRAPAGRPRAGRGRLPAPRADPPVHARP